MYRGKPIIRDRGGLFGFMKERRMAKYKHGLTPINTSVLFNLLGIFTWGSKKGQVNPKEVVQVRLYGESVKDCIGKMNSQSDGGRWHIAEVEDHSDAYSKGDILRPAFGFAA